MKNYKVLLCDEEEGFVMALMNYINRNSNIPILAMAFTEEKSLAMYLEQHKADLLVINAAWKKMETMSELNCSVLWMLDESEQKSSVEPEGYCISKYTLASDFVRNMLQILSEKKPFISTGANSSCMAVYSPIGRCGKTRFAHALCENQVMNTGITAGRSIYLGMEEYGENETENHGMDALLYFVKQQAANLSLKMKSLAIEQKGYDVIFSALSYRELRDLQKEDIGWLLNCVRTEGYYDLLLADIGSGSLSDIEILAEFDVIYFPYLQDNISGEKVQAFCRSLKNQGLWERIYTKCYPVLLQDRKMEAKEAGQLEEQRRKGVLRTLDCLCSHS